MFVIDDRGKIKICVPITGQCKEAIEEQILAAQTSGADYVELRADMWMDRPDVEEGTYISTLLQIVKELRHLQERTPFLFTWRTLSEGGSTALCEANYEELLRAIVDQGIVEAIDIELFAYTDAIGAIMHKAIEKGIVPIMSYHNFQSTPDDETLQIYAQRMVQLGAKVIKFALMPECADHVLRLLGWTRELQLSLPHIPRIVIAMGPLGQVTRTCGTVFGNCLTFGTVGEGSAPGQVEVEVLRTLAE